MDWFLLSAAPFLRGHDRPKYTMKLILLNLLNVNLSKLSICFLFFRCVGCCFWYLLGSLPCGPLGVELHRHVICAAPQDFRERSHHIWSFILPELCCQPNPLQPDVYQVQRNVQSHHVLFKRLASTFKLSDDSAQHTEWGNAQQWQTDLMLAQKEVRNTVDNNKCLLDKKQNVSTNKNLSRRPD